MKLATQIYFGMPFVTFAFFVFPSLLKSSPFSPYLKTFTLFNFDETCYIDSFWDARNIYTYMTQFFSLYSDDEVPEGIWNQTHFSGINFNGIEFLSREITQR